jgi:hypothetical protein
MRCRWIDDDGTWGEMKLGEVFEGASRKYYKEEF